MPRVAVIGRGLAAAAAAAAAREKGAQVVCVAADGGATSFSSGGLDFCGDPCPPAEALEAERKVEKNIARLIARNPSHPYARFGSGEKAASEVVIELLKSALGSLFAGGLYPCGKEFPRENRLCFTALGTLKWSAFFPGHTAALEAEGMERVAVTGINGFIDFNPWLWAKNAQEMAMRLGKGLSPRPVSIAFGSGKDRQAPELAREIDRDPEGFAAAVKKALSGLSDVSGLVFPPVLGFSAREKVIEELEQGLSLPVYETLSLPPSVPGLRLSQFLKAGMEDKGVELVKGRVTGFFAEGGRVVSLLASAGGEEREISAQGFVLASGGFLGGGLKKERAFLETIFGLPVFLGGREAGEVFIGKALAREVQGPHQVFEAGLMIDHELRPLNSSGGTCFENLFACGSVLSGYNPMIDGTGAGVALATGYRAGENAAGC